MKIKFNKYNCGLNPNGGCFFGCKLKSCEHCIYREINHVDDIINFWCSKHNRNVTCNTHCKYYKIDREIINGNRI